MNGKTTIFLISFAIAIACLSCKKKDSDQKQEQRTGSSGEWGFSISPAVFPRGLITEAVFAIEVGDPGWRQGGKATFKLPVSILDTEINSEYVENYGRRSIEVVADDSSCSGDWTRSMKREGDSLVVDIVSSGGCSSGAKVKVTFMTPDRMPEGDVKVALDLSDAVGEEGVTAEAVMKVASRTPSVSDGKGSCTVTPNKVTAGSSADVIIDCVTEGIKNGGVVSIGFPHPLYSTRPLTIIPGVTKPELAPSVVATAEANASFKAIAVQRSINRTLDIGISQDIPVGGKISITLPGVVLYESGTWPIDVWTDADGDGAFDIIPAKAAITVSPGAADSWRSTATFYSKPDQMAMVRLLAVDEAGNPIPSKRPGKAEITGTSFFTFAMRDGANYIELRKEDGDFANIEMKIPGAKNQNLKATIFPYDEKLSYRILWGDLHGHTGYTDGHGTPDEYYSFARRVGALDFAAITEHQQWMDDDEWEDIQASAARNTKQNSFVALSGIEIANGSSEHTNLIFPGRANLTRPAGPPCKEIYVFDFNGCVMSLFFKSVADVEKAATENGGLVFVHRAGTHGKFAIAMKSELQPVVEIYSAHGSAENMSDSNKIPSMEQGDQTVEELIASGRRLGVIANGDSHDGRPGMTMWEQHTGGVTAVLAKDLSTASLFEALRSRRTYATTGRKIPLMFKLDNHYMGEEFKANRYIKVFAAGTGNLDVRQYVNGQWYTYQQRCDFDYCAYPFELDLSKTPGTNIFYLRVTDSSGAPIAWSSPIWATYNP